MLSKRQVVVGLGVLSFVPLIVAIALGLMSVQLNSRQLEAFAVLSASWGGYRSWIVYLGRNLA